MPSENVDDARCMGENVEWIEGRVAVILVIVVYFKNLTQNTVQIN